MKWLILFSCCLYVASAIPAFDYAEQVARTIYSLLTDPSYEEAPYAETRLGDEIVKRNYPAKQWVCNTKSYSDVDEQQSGQFWRVFSDVDERQRGQFWKLFRYIQGANADSVQIEMTVPVRTHIMPRSEGGDTREMCFFIEEEHQESVPAPTNPDNSVTTFSGEIYTRTFGGYPSEATWRAEAEALKAKLTEMGLTFDASSYYTVAYDAPFKWGNRRNEVWFKKL